MMWWALWCAVVVAGGAGVAAAPAPDALSPLDMVQMDSPTQDDEGLAYVSPMGGRYAAGAPWLYLLAEVPRDSQSASGRVKRRMPSLSIDQPMSVLRQKLNQEKERKALALRAAVNRNFLNDIGKREAVGTRGTRAAEAQDAVAVHQQPYGGAATAASAGSGPQADARGQPTAGRGQPTLPAKRWQTRILG